MSKTSFDTIIYHAPCSDGTASAWAIWRENRKAKLIPAKHGMKLNPVDYTGKSVAIVDFSFSRDYLLEIAEKSFRTVLLDHHKSAERDLTNLSLPNLEIIFDMFRSGAQISWDYMNPSLTKNRPWFVEMVADRDLWKWELPWSKSVGKATLEMGYHSSVEKVEELIRSNKCHDEFIKFGQCLLDKEEKDIQSYVDKAILCQMKTPLGTYKVAVSSPPYFLRSDVANRIVNKCPVDFAVMYTYNFPTDEWWMSCRACDESKIDLSEIMKSLPNGGGHPKAAGFTIYGPESTPPEQFLSSKGETMYTYLTKSGL
jgi:uncharacterized protein